MVKIKVIAVGKVKEKYYSEALNEYSKRLSRYCDIKIVEVKEENFLKEPNESQKLEILKLEAEHIKKEIKGYLMVTAIEGKKFSSVDFSKKIDSIKNVNSEISIVIGGSYGVDDSIKQMAQEKISFSDMTFPHTLFRVLILEQLYRAFSILNDGKYHK
jgi:23S rRNA (pseudouridine1915-N3)-methyltransferase